MVFVEPERLGELPPYLFVEIDRKKRAAQAAGQDVIDFGVGDPDRATPRFIVEAMAHAIGAPAHHRYPLGKGSVEFRHAVAAFFHKRYGVSLDADSEILALIGSKEGLGHLPLATINPGDVALIPDPGYPVYRSATIFAGGRPHTVPLRESHGWLPRFDEIPGDVLRAARLLIINYPNNPTGACAPRSFYEEAVAFARANDLLLVQDAAYNEMYHDAHIRPPSVLEIPGARDVAIEMHSCSKTFNMTGWRVGFAVGHAGVLAALAKVKANVDSGVFGAVQEAAIAALTGVDRPELDDLRRMYAQRAQTLCGGLRELGFRVEVPKATFYVWAGVPDGADAMTICSRLIEEAHVVCVPGVGFGSGGAGHVRFALTVENARIAEAVRRMKSMRW